MALILDAHPAVRALAGNCDGCAVGQRADLGAAGAPGVADVQRLGVDVARAAELCDGDIRVVNFVVHNGGAQNNLKVVLPQSLEAAEEHRHRLLTGGVVTRVQGQTGGGLGAVDVFALHADLGCLDSPGRELADVREFGQIRAVNRRMIRNGIAEVLNDLEKLLTGEGLVGLERAVGIAAHDAKLVCHQNRGVRRVGEVVRPLKLDGVLGDEAIGVDGERTHLRAGDVLLEVIALERGRDEIELFHFVVVGLKPVAVVPARDGRDARDGGKEHHGAKCQTQQPSCTLLHSSSSFSSNPTGQWSEP